ncbi:MAG TPA: molybdenum cofactor biosynthesis protein MoaE [Geobacteraceae bacterium]|nr:molybdenum cofactor biosynthesis protein MoaE [Geobacteraceae bacterium]
MQRITDKPIDPATSYDLIARNSSGSVLFHYAVVKAQQGAEGTTCRVDYSLSGDAEEELRAIAADMAASWSIEDSLLIRRIGQVGVGEIISLVAVSSPASEDAFAACKYGIGRLKKMRCINKKEVCG